MEKVTFKTFVTDERDTLVQLLQQFLLMYFWHNSLSSISDFKKLTEKTSLYDVGNQIALVCALIVIGIFLSRLTNIILFKPVVTNFIVLSAIVIFLINQLGFMTAHQRFLINTDYLTVGKVFILFVSLLTGLLAIVNIVKLILHGVRRVQS